MNIQTKQVSWTINKASGSLQVSSNSISLDYAHLQSTVTINRAGNGAIHAQSNNTDVDYPRSLDAST